jgi:peptidoglycan/LPS O-acetylase OafA/YrhL
MLFALASPFALMPRVSGARQGLGIALVLCGAALAIFAASPTAPQPQNCDLDRSEA